MQIWIFWKCKFIKPNENLVNIGESVQSCQQITFFVLKKENRLKVAILLSHCQVIWKIHFQNILTMSQGLLYFALVFIIMFKIPDFLLLATTFSDMIFITAWNFIRNIFLLLVLPLLEKASSKAELCSWKSILSLLVSIWQKRA